MAIERILIVDDEALIRSYLYEALERKGFEVTVAASGKQALIILKDKSFDLVITDMRLGDMTGLDVLKKVKEISKETVVVVITAHGTVENAVSAMRQGAFNYLLKPFTPEAIEVVIEKANEHLALVNENTYLKQDRLKSKLIVKSASMKKFVDEAIVIARSNASVLIQGESGTGKEVFAELMHTHSKRADKPYIRVNCAAIPDTLIESEFFGHEKGSFTGASNRRIGRFELANTGTLLLDEVTEIPIALQPKLLRVIQEKEFERVGGTRPVNVDVRLISTTNRDIREAIEQKVFREDLYYRLGVIPLYLPPLRKRKEDIIPLAEHFLHKDALDNNAKPKQLTNSSKEKLIAYSWPGNIRELANIMERIAVLNAADAIEPHHIYLDALETNLA